MLRRLRQKPEEPVADGLFERAAARFNASPSGGTVAGLARTLGEPRVSVGAAAASPGLVRITVAWELTWYQWGVDVADPDRPVFELRHGGEIAELDAAAQHWNARAGEGGRIVVGAATGAPVAGR